MPEKIVVGAIIHVVKRGQSNMCFPIPIAIVRRSGLQLGLSGYLQWDGGNKFIYTVTGLDEVKRETAEQAAAIYGADAGEAAEIAAADDADVPEIVDEDRVRQELVRFRQVQKQREDREKVLRDLDIPEEPETGDTFR